MSIEILKDGDLVASFSSDEVTEVTVTHDHGHTQFVWDAVAVWENIPLDDLSWVCRIGSES